MILIHRFEPQIAEHTTHAKTLRSYEELQKIFDFVDLPDSIREIEQANSAILRNYYANALDHNLLDLRTVKYLIGQKLKAKGMTERAVEQYTLAEEWLFNRTDQSLTIAHVQQLYKILVLDLYNNRDDLNLFSSQHVKTPERLSSSSESDLEALFDFINNDTTFHPIQQSWILHLRFLEIPTYSESQSKIAILLQHFWLRKKGYDLHGFMSLANELYLHKNVYRNFMVLPDKGELPEEMRYLDTRLNFGMKIFDEQLDRLKSLLRTYFRKQVEYHKGNSRLKNIMNYVFENGYKLREIDDEILNKRQKLIMYIIQNRGHISTKELVSEFDCNRKTIQRDFNALADLNLIRIIGKGAGLKYSVNLTQGKHGMMEKYQADFLRSVEEIVPEEDVTEIPHF